MKKREYLRLKFNRYTKENFSDREFRSLVAEEPRIITCTKGYYILPKKNISVKELIVAFTLIKENKAKATSLLSRISKQISELRKFGYYKELFTS